MKLFALFLLAVSAMPQSWIPHSSGSKASLRGVSAVSSRIVWASGSDGAILLTLDGGNSWRRIWQGVQLDFRDVEAFDERTAYVLAAGPGGSSRIYKTGDGGAHWTLQFTNPDASGFFDGIAFWDFSNGIVFGDPVGEMAVFTTRDGGAHWDRQKAPAALKGEGAFAASGTSIITLGKNECWFATGGEGAARVFHSFDRGRSWTVVPSPVRKDSASAGIFSLAFRDSTHGIAIGGEYKKSEESEHNLAITSDGGKTWREPHGKRPGGYRSAVVYVPKRRAWIAVGPSGSDISTDDGENWRTFNYGSYNALSVARDGSLWAVGANGRIAEYR